MKVAQIVTTSDGKKFTGEDAMAKGQAHENALKLKALFNAFADHIGMKDGKTGRRKVSLELIAAWEAARHEGVLDDLQCELDDKAEAARAAAAAAAEAAKAAEPEAVAA
jgi:hypothetical protein